MAPRRRPRVPAVLWALIPAVVLGYTLAMALAHGLAPASSPVTSGRASGPAGRASGPSGSPGADAGELPRSAVLNHLTSEVYVAGAEAPVRLAFAPDGRLFYAELAAGRVRVVVDGVLQPEPVLTVPNVRVGREYGLVGLALDPDFPENGYLYVYYTENSDPPRNRLLRYRVEGNRSVGEPVVLLDDIPAGVDCCHNGGSLLFGPDGLLYVGVGDTQRGELAQDKGSLAGKILRLNPDGSPARDNPFFYTLDVTAPQNYVYAMGLRNPFGLAYNPATGQFFASENGDHETDEVNELTAGGNYGWPVVKGKAGGDFDSPLVVYNPVIAPAGITVYTGDAIPELRGDILMCSFNRAEMFRIRLMPPEHRQVLLQERLATGCMLDVAQGPDGFIYFSDLQNIYRLRPSP